MNNTNNMSHLFEKLDDLKKVFVYGERLIPIIQSLVDFMRDTVPLLDNINRSLADSTSKIPKVTNQINDVTIATEMATTEILDLVDGVNIDIMQIKHLLEALNVNEKQKEEMFEIFSETLNNEQKKSIAELSALIDNRKLLESLNKLISKIKADANNITISLQVQDITSQQLAAVIHLIRSVQGRLSSLVMNFDESNLKGSNDFEIGGNINSTFNPDAKYQMPNPHQNDADEIFKSGFEKPSQDEIDRLFE